MRRRFQIAVVLALGLAGCDGAASDLPGPCEATYQLLAFLRIDRVDRPAPVVPGSVMRARGESFIAGRLCVVPEIVLEGRVDGVERVGRARGEVLSNNDLAVTVTAETVRDLGSRGVFDGLLVVRFESVDGGNAYVARTPLSFDLAPTVAAEVTTVEGGPDVYLNDELIVSGTGFLSGEEGLTELAFEGTFTEDATGASTSIREAVVPVEPLDPLDRQSGTFLWSPRIAGVVPGQFEGTMTPRNLHASGERLDGSAMPVSFSQRQSLLVDVSPSELSLGQIASVSGRGFIGHPEGTTEVRLDGFFTYEDGSVRNVTVSFVGLWRSGSTLEYPIAVSAETGILHAVDFGARSGRFEGSATPVLVFGTDREEGLADEVTIELGPVMQVAWVRFLPGFSESLELFGLGAVEAEVRARILERMRQIYCPPEAPERCVNVDFRAEEPEDFYGGAYAVIDVGGPDPNGIGLFGYDNTPGKDVNNLRLHDHVGGENALGSLDGFGYGGVFIESMLFYSEHPPMVERPLGAPASEPRFDEIFDPLRAAEVVAGEWPEGASPDRVRQIEEGIHTLSSIVADTAAHEFGHSLGLAQPFGRPDAYHNQPPAEGCLMDSGRHRPFEERARVDGNPGSRFCGENLDYLLAILPRR